MMSLSKLTCCGVRRRQAALASRSHAKTLLSLDHTPCRRVRFPGCTRFDHPPFVSLARTPSTPVLDQASVFQSVGSDVMTRRPQWLAQPNVGQHMHTSSLDLTNSLHHDLSYHHRPLCPADCCPRAWSRVVVVVVLFHRELGHHLARADEHR
jgi:hypothetical protein